jgi:hypothetical protein
VFGDDLTFQVQHQQHRGECRDRQPAALGQLVDAERVVAECTVQARIVGIGRA